jgi:hypothetical protein
MTSHRFITKSLTIGLAATALGAPFASAGPPADIHLTPQEQQVLASRGQGAPEPIARIAPVSDDGFDWGSAGIGAGAAGALTLVALGAFGLAGNRRVRVAR